MTDAGASLALDLAAAAIPSVLRAGGQRGGRSATVRYAWHDTLDGVLAAGRRVLVHWRAAGCTGWRIDPLDPSADPALSVATLPRIGQEVPANLHAFAHFSGGRRAFAVGPVRCILLDGSLSTSTSSQPLHRLILTGPAAEVASLALALPAVRPAAHSVAELARRLADRADPFLPAPLPRLGPEQTLNEAIALILQHFALLLQASVPAAAAGQGVEPVHQMRVALRRLRSALRLVRRAAPGLALHTTALRQLGQTLGPARDWDVFLAGLGPAAAAALPDAKKMAPLLAAARRRRAEAYVALRGEFADDAFRRLIMALTCAGVARPWTEAAAADHDALDAGLDRFANHALARQWRRLLAPGGDLAGLPEPRLHAIRLEAKRMRYAAELLAPLFPGRDAERLITRLRLLQDQLGHLNDGAVAATLMAELGPAGRGFAGGAVRGLVAGRGDGLRSGIAEAWRKLRKTSPFWA